MTYNRGRADGAALRYLRHGEEIVHVAWVIGPAEVLGIVAYVLVGIEEICAVDIVMNV